MACDMCVCALLYEQNKVLLEGCEKELEGCRRSQNEVSSMETCIHVQCTVSPACSQILKVFGNEGNLFQIKSWKMLC